MPDTCKNRKDECVMMDPRKAARQAKRSQLAKLAAKLEEVTPGEPIGRLLVWRAMEAIMERKKVASAVMATLLTWDYRRHQRAYWKMLRKTLRDGVENTERSDSYGD